MANILGPVPDWVFFCVLGLVALLIYLNLPDNLKKGARMFLRRYAVWIILICVWLYWHGKTGPIYEFPDLWPAEVNRATFFVLMFGLLYFAANAYLYEHRYKTYHFICDNIQGSCARWEKIATAGSKNDNLIIFYIGGSGLSDDSWVIPWPFVQKIVVVPEKTVTMVGNQIVSIAKVELKDVIELLPPVKERIQRDTFGRWAQDNVYAGYFTSAKLGEDPQYQELLTLTDRLSAQVNKRDLMLKGDLGVIKQQVAGTVGIQNKLRGERMPMQGPPMGQGEQ